MKVSITNGFDRLSPAKLLLKARIIVGEVGVNTTYFPAPDPSLAEITAAIEEFERAVQAAENRDRVAISYRNEQRDVLVNLLRKLGNYVNLQADGNRTIALSSGFDVAKDPSPLPSIILVETPQLSPGVNAGQIEARNKAVAGAKAYQYFIHTDVFVPVNQWQLYPSTRSRYSFTGLESGKRYYVKVGVVGVNNQLVYSEASSFITQ